MPRNYVAKTKGFSQPKPMYPPPTFKYGSNTYICLAYAKMVNRAFSIQDIRKFTNRYDGDYEVKRSLDVLEKNGSVEKLNKEYWKITPKGVQQLFDFAKRRQIVPD